nr:biotin/lipoyl-containing protein [Chenggangzhangella methanolivorans]
MATEIRVPTLGESVTEATIGRWFKKPGEAVKADEPVVELETDKVTLEVPAAAGVLGQIEANEGDTVGVDALLGSIEEGGAGAAPAKKDDAKPAAGSKEAAKPVADTANETKPKANGGSAPADAGLAPSVRRLAEGPASTRPRSRAPARTAA